MAFMKRPSLRSSFPRHKTGLILFGFLIHSNLLSTLDPFVSRHIIYQSIIRKKSSKKNFIKEYTARVVTVLPD